jgi:hypothetical protein
VVANGYNVVVRLPAAVTISELVINPSATCGDDPTASTGKYRVETSANGTTWAVGAESVFANGTVTPTGRRHGNGCAVRPVHDADDPGPGCGSVPVGSQWL